MGYTLPRGITKYRGQESVTRVRRDRVEDGRKRAPRIPITLPLPVKIPPPPVQSNPPKN